MTPKQIAKWLIKHYGDDRILRCAASVKEGYVTNGSILVKVDDKLAQAIAKEMPNPGEAKPLRVDYILQDKYAMDARASIKHEEIPTEAGCIFSSKTTTVFEVTCGNLTAYVNAKAVNWIEKLHPKAECYYMSYKCSFARHVTALYWFKDGEMVAALSPISEDAVTKGKANAQD